MKSAGMGVFVIAGLLISAAAFGQEPQTEKVLLKEASPAVGDVYVVAVRDDLEMQVRGVPEGSKEAVVDAPFIQKVQEKYTQSILAVSGGKPTHYTRKYNISKVTQTKSAGADPTTVNLPRHGKTLTVRTKGNAITVTAGKEKLPANEIATLKRVLQGSSDVSPYPDYPVGPGDEWTKEGKEVTKDGGARKLTGKFLDFVDYEGHRCALIAITMEMAASQAGLPLQITMSGEVKHAVDIHRDLIVTLNGDVKTSSKITNNGITVELTGNGITSFTQTEVWLKSKGKPVLKRTATPAAVPAAAAAQ